MASIHSNNTTSTLICVLFFITHKYYVLALVGKIKRTFFWFYFFFGSHGIRIQLAHRRAEKNMRAGSCQDYPQKRNRCLSPNSSRKKEHVRQTPGYCSLSDRWRIGASLNTGRFQNQEFTYQRTCVRTNATSFIFLSLETICCCERSEKNKSLESLVNNNHQDYKFLFF
jgi:hypothetical protein